MGAVRDGGDVTDHPTPQPHGSAPAGTGTRPRGSALVALVPELEPVVGVHRQRLDPSAAGGVPAHVTVLYPFVEPTDLDDATITTLQAVVDRTPAFDCTFRQVVWFEDGLLTLAPEPDGPFRALTDAVCAAFPGHPPYGGRYEPVPHVTLGYADTPRVERETAAALIEPQLPVRGRVDRLHVMVDDHAGVWETVHELPLGTG